MKWKVFYPDSEYKHDSDIPWYAPGTDVQAVLYKTEEGWQVMSGYNYYLWDVAGDQWIGAQTIDALILYLAKPGLKKVLFTSEISDTDHGLVISSAVKERRELNDS